MALTPGNIDDRQPVPQLVRKLFGKVFADRGYISKKLSKEWMKTFGLELITKRRKNMKNQLIPLADKLLLRKRAIIETIIDQRKNISPIEHTRHRSPVNFLANLLCALIAYCHQPKKPALNFKDIPQLLVAQTELTLTFNDAGYGAGEGMSRVLMVPAANQTAPGPVCRALLLSQT